MHEFLSFFFVFLNRFPRNKTRFTPTRKLFLSLKQNLIFSCDRSFILKFWCHLRKMIPGGEKKIESGSEVSWRVETVNKSSSFDW